MIDIMLVEQQLNSLDPEPHSVDFSVKALYCKTPKTKAKVEQTNIIIPVLDLAQQKPKDQESFRNKRESIHFNNQQPNFAFQHNKEQPIKEIDLSENQFDDIQSQSPQRIVNQTILSFKQIQLETISVNENQLNKKQKLMQKSEMMSLNSIIKKKVDETSSVVFQSRFNHHQSSQNNSQVKGILKHPSMESSRQSKQTVRSCNTLKKVRFTLSHSQKKVILQI